MSTPERVRRWSAPGRVNLVGEHLDYHGGPALPIAIDRRVTVKGRVRDDSTVRIWTDGGRPPVETHTAVRPGEVDGWAAYVAGVVWSLGLADVEVPGADLVIGSDVPEGAGLSSSAALECAVASALLGLAGVEAGEVDVALWAQRAENDFVGAPTGAMDQLASMCGRAGSAVLLDHRPDPPVAETVPAAWTDDGLRLLVVDTRAAHSHADSEYGARRAEAEAAATALGLERLVDARLDDVVRLEDETQKARVRHVVTETARTRAAVRALREHRWEQLGTIFTASHASLRDDYAVSCVELDLAVDTALEHGALGARMTGGGFGGSAIALVPADRGRALVDAVETAFASADLTAPRCFVVTPSDGARED